MKMSKLLLSLLLVCSLVCGTGYMSAEAGRLDDIQARGKLLVGTTGDYKPMSYLNKDTGLYEGFDTELARLLAKSLNVEVEFVPTTWKTLTEDTLNGKFDVALCGITRTAARMQQMDMSHGYLIFGKTILCRKADAAKFTSLDTLNKASVTVMVNPGGTNEKFALANLKNAKLKVHPKNAEIPALIAAGEADIMITETMEARRYVRDDARLAAPLLDNPFTRNQFGILMAKGDQDFLNYVNFIMEENTMNGTLAQLEDKYIK